MTTIATDGSANAIYLQMSGTIMQYSIGTRTIPGNTFIDISAWPVTIVNETPTSSAKILNVKATMNLTISPTTTGTTSLGQDIYFIAGSEYITFDGSGNTININNILTYSGFIQNGTGENSSIDPTGTGYANVIVQNLTTGGSGSTLYPASGISERAGGWLCRPAFGKQSSANQILNCTNNLPITGKYCGGIVGSLVGNGIGSSVTISGCTNTINGLVNGQYGGGIVGTYAGNDDGVVLINNCTNNAVISGQYSGGICGSSSAQRNGKLTLNLCVNIGNITIDQAGGIVGSGGAYNNGLLIIQDCTNSGVISGQYSGGITGQGVGSGGDVEVSSCTNSGIITGSSAGGILGWQCAQGGGRLTTTNCVNTITGIISGQYAGGIAGAESATLSGNATFTGCTNNAIISGDFAGGIVGAYAGGKEIIGNGAVSINNCTNTGQINAPYGGGIAGRYAGYNDGSASFSTCTNTGEIAADYTGGIAGQDSGYNGGNVSFSVCINDSDINGLSAGGIVGPYAGNGTKSEVTFTDCTNNGDINGEYGGGIAGQYVGNNGGNSTFIRCTNTGQIIAESTGGIAGDQVGTAGSAIFTNCVNTITGIISGQYAGGIVGRRAGYNLGGAITFISCTNSGPINADFAGGIAGEQCGYNSGSAIFTDCSNNGIITGQYAGGIAGASAGFIKGTITFTRCKNSGIINGSYGGGISGYQTGYDGLVDISGCTNTGSINAQHAGGIVGSRLGLGDGTATLTNCTNSAEISGKYSGGIAGERCGENGNAIFTSCRNTGPINTPNGGGIAGYQAGYSGNATFTSCVNSGNIAIVAQYSGGIAGQNAGYGIGNAIFISCTNSGIVGAWFSGGIAGDQAGYTGVARFETCNNTGSISVNGDYCGGIAGSNAGSGTGSTSNQSSATFIDCTNSGVISRNSAGGIAGYQVGANIGGNATFTNCTNTGEINGLHYTGGITAQLAGKNGGKATFTNCTNTGEIITELAGGIAGELCGYNNGRTTFTNCINEGNISGLNAGGIAGQYAGYNGRATFIGCTNTGSINDSAVSGGGIAGQYAGKNCVDVSFNNCTNTGSINALYAGGIAGQYVGDGSGNIGIQVLFNNCTNTGPITAQYAGGIAGQYAGYNKGIAIFTDCSNNGTINSNATSAGGIAGQYAGNTGIAQFNDCINTGSIQAIAAGGIVGANAASGATSQTTFLRCTNTGLISGQDAGGIAGQYAVNNNGTATLTSCTNTGLISGVYAGGILGSYAGKGNSNNTLISFDSCLNSGNITSQYAGGIVGAYAGSETGSITINKCFSIGIISGEYAGGITGGKFASNTNTTCTISNCYSTGNINVGVVSIRAGGIVGADIGYNTSALYTPTVLIYNCYSLGTIGESCGGILGGVSGFPYTNRANISINNCYSYGVLNGTGQGIVAASLTITYIILTPDNLYVANGFWNNANANADLAPGTTPTSLKVGNPGSVWTTLSTTFLPNIPYVLSVFNEPLYDPNFASSSTNYSSEPGAYQPDYNYKIIYSDQPLNSNTITTRVFSYKGISPYYYSYDSNIFTFTNTNGIPPPNNIIYVSVVQSTGVLNFTLPVNNTVVVIQIPDPFTPYAVSPNNVGEVSYTDLDYIIIPDISNNPTYTLSTDVTNSTYDIFQDSITPPAAFIPNSLFINNNLIAPGGIVKDSFGNFYVGNTAYNIISVFDSSGNYLRAISIYSSVNVPVLTISYLTIDDSNNLYVTSNSTTGVFVVPQGNSINDINNTILKYIYGNDLRGLTCNANYLYIVKQAIPKYVIKYDLTNQTYLQIPLSLATPPLPLTCQPNAIIYNNINSSPTLYITTIDGSNNRVYSIANITGTLTLTGGDGSAVISSSTTLFPDNEYPYSITMDNSANLYVGLDKGRITPVNTSSVGQIARVTTTGAISNTSYLSYNGLGIGRPDGILFDGSLNLYVSDILHNRVIKSNPKTFIFGPSVLNADAFYIKDPLTPGEYKTYLYDITNSIITTTFDLAADCFQKGTKILCENDIYVPIENIKVGDLVKTYKHGYQKVIRCVIRRSCDYVISSRNQIYKYTQKSNPELIEDLYLTGGHSLLLDALSEPESNDMKQVDWADCDFMVEDKYKLMCCFNKKLDVSENQNVELYRFELEPPENATPTHVYGIWANGILSESCSKASMDK